MKGRLCLNLDHVVNMMCKYVECKDWQEAFEFAAPKRWKKDEKNHEKEEISALSTEKKEEGQ